MTHKLVYVILATVLVAKPLYGQESVCGLFSHLAPQTEGRQLVLTGDLIISKDIAVLGSWECDNRYISQQTLWPTALSLQPSEKLSAQERRDFQEAALKVDNLRSKGKVVNATATFSGALKVAPKGQLPAELVFDSFKNFAIEILSDPASLPVIPICDLFKDLRTYQEKRIAVRGEFVSTMEGQWIVGRCQGAFVTDGYTWPVALSVGRPAYCSQETEKFCEAKRPEKWPENPDYMVDGYSDGATTATFVGNLRMRSKYEGVCLKNGFYVTNGFGHLNGAVAEFIVENIMNPEATPPRMNQTTLNSQSQRCVPSNMPSN